MTNTLFIFLILEKIIVLQSYPILHHRLVPNKPVKNHRYLYRNHIHSGKEYTKSKILLLPFQLAYTPSLRSLHSIRIPKAHQTRQALFLQNSVKQRHH